ncbi:MAG TPA: hypothetical protein VKZ18_21090 [Polyangia bacterium]|nr:hypothetical protein [Polyangia bacterium]
MQRPPRRRSLRLCRLLALAAGLAAGCSSPQEPHGSPVLLNVYWIAAGKSQVVWDMMSGSAATPAPPGAQEIDFVFDRLLDGNRIEDTVTQNGVQTTVPKAMPPITASWPDMATAMGVPPFVNRVIYNSLPLYGGTTAYVAMQPTPLGFPAADTVTFALDKTGLTSAYGDQMTGPAQIPIVTAPLTASFRLPSAGDASTAVPPSYKLPVVFNNRLGETAALAPFIHAEANGTALPLVLTADATDPTIIYLSPASCLAGWPTDVPIVAEIAAGAPDAFGVPLGAASITTFMATGPKGAGPDGGCPGPDAGGDAGTTDAGRG